MQADRQLAEAMQVGHALIMLAELPDHSANAAYPIAVRIACLESFYSSLRLMFEFLIDKPKRGHIHRHDYLLGWTRPPATRSTPFGGGRVRRRAGVTSGQEQAFGRWAHHTVSPPEMKRLAVLTLDVTQQFVGALEAFRAPSAQTFRGYVDDARGRIR